VGKPGRRERQHAEMKVMGDSFLGTSGNTVIYFSIARMILFNITGSTLFFFSRTGEMQIKSGVFF